MLKSSQIIVFWHFEGSKRFNKNKIFQARGRPQGNADKTDPRFSSKMMIFQGRGRPQGNGDNTDLRLFKTIQVF